MTESSERRGESGWQTAALFLLSLAILGLCGLMLYPFLTGITGAIVLAVITRRPFHWWRATVRNRTAAALSALLVITISVIAPLLLLGQYLVRQAVSGAQMILDGRALKGVNALVDRFPQVAVAFENSSEFIALGDAAHRFAAFVASRLIELVSNSMVAAGQVIVMLFLLFFLYRDEEGLNAFLHRLLPLKAEEAVAFTGRLGETIRATVLGRLLIATVQGTVAGTVFAALGIHPAVILGLLTAVSGMVPPFGPYLIWLPLAVWLGFTGHWVRMGILFGVGSLVVSTLDNLLYPMLVGSTLRQHTVAVFLSLLGGVWLFGVSGLVLGPLAFSAAEALLRIWKSRVTGDSTPDKC